MNVGLIFDQTLPFVSGYSMRSKYLAESLAEYGVTCLACRSPIFKYDLSSEKIAGVTYFTTPPLESKSFASRYPVVRELLIVRRIVVRLRDLVAEGVNILHAHSSVLNGLAALYTGRRNKIPFVYEVRALWEDAAVDQGKTKEGDFRYRVTRAIESFVLRRADHVTVICEGLRSELITRGIPESKITIVPNGVDTNAFRPIPYNKAIAAKHGLEGKKVIGFIGTFFLFEGVELLVRAAAELAAQHSDVMFLIVGGGRQEDAVAKLVKDLGIKDKVILTGRVDHAIVKDYYSVIDYLVYPRLSKRITELVTPLKPLEAMGMAKTVLASDVGGLKELVRDGDTGLLFAADDVQALVKCCCYALENPDEMASIASRARQYVESERSWSRVTENYLPVYESLGAST